DARRLQEMALPEAARGEAAPVHVGLRLGEEDRNAGRGLARSPAARRRDYAWRRIAVRRLPRRRRQPPGPGRRRRPGEARGQRTALGILQAHAPTPGQLVDDAEAGVVAGGAVLLPRVAQAQDEVMAHASSVLPFLITSGSASPAPSPVGSSPLACITETST